MYTWQVEQAQAPPHCATIPCTPCWRAVSISVMPSGA